MSSRMESLVTMGLFRGLGWSLLWHALSTLTMAALPIWTANDSRCLRKVLALLSPVSAIILRQSCFRKSSVSATRLPNKKFGDFSLPSSEGWQQGDPLAGFGFSSTIHPGLDAIKTRFKQGYLDDISKGDNWRVVLTKLRAFIEFATSLGLSLNANKSELTILEPNTSLSDDIIREFNDLLPSITVTKLCDLEMLGAPIGQKALDPRVERETDFSEDYGNEWNM